jgi:hypothetical protein
MTRYERIMSGAAEWCAYYRSNPHRFVADYLHVELRLFQKILVVMMNICTVVAFIGARGIGKTFLSAIFCVVRAILYPGTKICIASGTRGQGRAVLEKILLELKPNSRELAAEIDEKQTKDNGTNAQIVFKNGSYIKVVTAGDSSRGNRANVLLLDEFRLISKDVIDTILRKFLTQRRMPRYAELTDAERAREYAKEKNMTMYLSSAFFADHWSYTKCQDTCRSMLDDTRRQFVCGLPYQLSIAEGLLDADTVADEMVETDFNEIKFSMEYEALWWGAGDGSFFDYATVSKNRKIKYAMLPDKLSTKLSNSAPVRIPPKQNGEIRILSADIALMSSKKNHNDATAVFINQMMLTKARRYTSNIVYAASYEGMHTDDQALVIRKLFDEYQCDYIVLDSNGIGLGVFDALAREMSDPETGDVYPALSCINDKTMAERCTAVDAEKVIWSVKANAQFNSDCAFLLREGFRSGKVRLLVSEYDADEVLGGLPGYSKLSAADQVLLQLAYINTTLLIDELVKLRHDESGGKIRISERAGMRKDRYSSLAYNFYLASQLEAKLAKRNAMNADLDTAYVIKAPKFQRKAVSGAYGKTGNPGWN